MPLSESLYVTVSTEFLLRQNLDSPFGRMVHE
jgi:hypothetical protein